MSTFEGEPLEGEDELLTQEEIMQLLLEQFDTADTNGDDMLSYEEALAIVNTLTMEQFNEIDADDDHFLSLEDLGADDRCGCFRSCRKGLNPIDSVKHMIGDWLLIGLAFIAIVGCNTIGHAQKK